MTDEGICVLIGLACSAIVLSLAVVEFRTEAACLAYGYPDHHLTWTLTRYCQRRENAYDVVVPLADLREGGQR